MFYLSKIESLVVMKKNMGDTINNRSYLNCLTMEGRSQYNNLKNTLPLLLNDNKIMLFDITKGNGKKVWWKCKRGHVWDASFQVETMERMSGGRYIK